MKHINFKTLWSNCINLIPPLLFISYMIKQVYYYVFIKNVRETCSDFICYWVASSLVLAGKATKVYDFSAFKMAVAAVAGPDCLLFWFYPPTFLLMVLPLSLAPVFYSLFVWLFILLACFVWIVYRIAPNRAVIGLVLGFPGTLVNIGYGQNGFLSATLFGGGLLLLKRHPWAAGLVLGLLSYKPHLGVLVPVALIAGRNWKALAGVFISTGLLVLASALVLGSGVWLGFLKSLPVASKMLYQGIEGSMPSWNQMASVFSAAHLAGLKPGAAFALQGLVMAVSLGLVLWVWFRGSSLTIRASILILAALLFPPYGYAYDLTILALPLAWLGWQGYTRGWLPGEQAILFIGWWAPLFVSYHLYIIPPVLIMLILLALRRMRHEEKSKQLPY